jgi:HAD superfamily hydrolase (TIGR01490 family)
MRLAIFDIDGTLVDASSERLFWRYLWRCKRLQARQLVAFVVFMLRYFPVAGRDVAKKNKAYLSGLTLDEVRRSADEFVDSVLWRRLNAPVVARLRAHQRQGDTVVLLSGTLQMIAQRLGDRLGVAHVCATLCSESDGKFVARPPERHPFAAAKLTLARELAREQGLDLRKAAAYCDSHHDVELLEFVELPVAVHPDPRLRAIACARGWELLSGEEDPRSVRQLGG